MSDVVDKPGGDRLMSRHHYGSFETIRRVRDGALLWLATCGCGQCWVAPDYGAAMKAYSDHVAAEYAEKETPQ